MKILLFGGSGSLGTELQKINLDIICPKKSIVDITSVASLQSAVIKYKPDIIINAAAETDNRSVEKNPIKAIETNIVGAANIAGLCHKHGIRYVYISTDYVYKGDKGNYKESDEILPFNLYSWTKLGGECSAVAVKNHLIIRTSFGANTFDYPVAFSDKWTSKDYVDKIAPLIYESAVSPLTGVLNLGTERKTLYSHAKERNETVKPVKIEDTNYSTPYDTSLNLQKWINYESSNPIAKPHTRCRVCNSEKLVKYLDLGLMPLANNLEFTAQRAKEKDRFPLQVMFCEECGLSQLSVVIDPEKMFSYYTYRSSVNKGYVRHCYEMAVSLQNKYDLTKESFHVDIAGNDGALLKEFKDKIRLNVLNVDPANNLTAIAESQGIESIADFWSMELSEKVLNSHGRADLITATNVFAHVDNVKEFILAAKILLKTDGILVLEFPYILDFIENCEFDTVYFEHLSYFSILPLMRLCGITGMKVINIEKQKIHGGTVRVTIANEHSRLQVESSVSEFVNKEIELGYNNIEKYQSWAICSKNIVEDFSSKLLELKKQGFKIAAFAASAKGNTLLNCCGMNTDIVSYVADETPEKIGKFSPGNAIPIVNKQQLMKDVPDYLVILSWNFSDEIMEKLKPIYKGRFIIPIPEFTIIENG